jgi:CDGSH-type Zn-finger protein
MTAGPDGTPPDAGSSDARELPVCAQSGPYEVAVVAGQEYLWCSCGLSARQPWCDGSHRETGFSPIRFTAPISAMYMMCGCKRSENPPYCFGNCRGDPRARSAAQSVW